MLMTLAVTGTALYGSVKLLRRRTQKQAQPSMVDAAAVERDQSAGPATPIDPDVIAPSGKATPPIREWRILNHFTTNPSLRKTSILALGGATSLTHIALGLQYSSLLFIWNGVGYATLLAANYAMPRLAPYRNESRDLLMAYTGTTIVAYVLQEGLLGLISPVGMVNKAVELGMLGLLWFEPNTERMVGDVQQPAATVLPVTPVGIV
jgi:hypothetical protein